MISQVLHEAKLYASLGWKVIPIHSVVDGVCSCPKHSGCKSPGKHPRLNQWQKQATTDEAIFVPWFEQWPEANVGVRLGPTSNIFDIEFDSDEGKSTASDLLGDVQTPTYRSQRSVHHLFTFPQGLTIPKAVVHWRGLELRFGTDGKGAQSVFPPSRHASGCTYDWIKHPSQVAVAEPPEWLQQALNGDIDDTLTFVMSDTTETLESHPGASQGNRNSMLCQLVGRYLAQHGATSQLVEQSLAWGARCSPPLDQSEILRVVAKLCESDSSNSSKPSKASSQQQHVKEILSTVYSDIEVKEVEWLWPNRLPLGKLSLLAGQPGLGKTFCSLDIAARVSTGSAFVDGSMPPLGQVGILSCEDGASDTLKPRLLAAGADMTKIFHIEGVRGKDRTEFLSLKSNVKELEDFFESKPDLRLFILDPISAFMGDKVDSHVNAEVRSVLGPLCELAERRRVALIGITHLTKGQAKAINSIIGSIAFVAAARAAFLVAPDNDNAELRLFLPIKNNLAKCTGLGFTIVEGAVVWAQGEVLVSADDIGDENDSPREEAKDWLLCKLETKAMPAKWILSESRKDGISERTLRRASKELGVVTERVNEAWVWRLPSVQQQQAEPGEWTVS